MKHYIILMMLMAAATLASCEKQTSPVEQKTQEESYVYTISAVAPDMVDESAPAQAPTRTDYAADGTFSWSAGDAISVLFHNGDDNKFFTLTTTGSGATAKFSGSIEAGYEIGASDGNDSDKKIWALFPASANHTYTAGSNPSFYVQPNVDFTATHFSANIPMYDLVASEGTALSFKNLASTYKFIVSGIKDGVDKVTFRIHNQSSYGLSGSWPIHAGEVYVNYDHATPGSANSTLTYVSNVTSNTAVFYVSCRYWGKFQPVITVSNYATGVAIKTFTATKEIQPTYMNRIQPITLDVSEINGGYYYSPAITIDGDLSDWSAISASFDNSSKSRVREWRFKSDAYNVYFYIKLRRNRVDGGKTLYIGLDTDNDNSTGSSYGDITGCESYIKAVPFTNSGEGTTPEPVEGFDPSSQVYVSGVSSTDGTVYTWDYDDAANNPLGSDSSNIWIELRASREQLHLTSPGTITVGCSYGWGTTDKVSVTLE